MSVFMGCTSSMSYRRSTSTAYLATPCPGKELFTVLIIICHNRKLNKVTTMQVTFLLSNSPLAGVRFIPGMYAIEALNFLKDFLKFYQEM